MLIYAYSRGGATIAGVVALAQLVPAALLAPAFAAVADRRSPLVLLAGGYLVQAAAMAATAVAIVGACRWRRTRRPWLPRRLRLMLALLTAEAAVVGALDLLFVIRPRPVQLGRPRAHPARADRAAALDPTVRRTARPRPRRPGGRPHPR